MRSGESAESIAADTGWDLVKVLRYAGPLLDERAFMAQQASQVEVRRSAGGATLEESCAQQVGHERAELIVWDSHRREDGRWVVTAAVPGEGSAAWTYDHHGRNLHPLDDLARALMGVAPAATTDVTDEDIAAALDLSAPVSVVRDAPPVRPHLVAVESPDDSASTDGDADDVALADVAGDEDVEVGTGSGRASSYEQETITLPREEPAAGSAQEDRPPTGRKTRGRKGRTSIPSWDEILFGAGRSDD